MPMKIHFGRRKATRRGSAGLHLVLNYPDAPLQGSKHPVPKISCNDLDPVLHSAAYSSYVAEIPLTCFITLSRNYTSQGYECYFDC